MTTAIPTAIMVANISWLFVGAGLRRTIRRSSAVRAVNPGFAVLLLLATLGALRL
ncbi:MAG: hypothetical protein WB783_12025 [Arenicellales bacterium]